MKKENEGGEDKNGIRFVSEELESYDSHELINTTSSAVWHYITVSPKPHYRKRYKWINITDTNRLRDYYYKTNLVFKDPGNYSHFSNPRKHEYFRKVKSVLRQVVMPITEPTYRRPYFNHFNSEGQPTDIQQGFKPIMYNHYSLEKNLTDTHSDNNITDTNFVADKDDDIGSDEGIDTGIIKDIVKIDRLQGIKYMEERTKFYNKTLDILFTRNLFLNFSDIFDTGYGRYSSVINKWYNKTFVPKYRLVDLSTPEIKNHTNRCNIYYGLYMKKLNAISKTYTHVLLTQLNGTASSNLTDPDRFKIRIPALVPSRRRFYSKRPLWVKPYFTPKVLYSLRDSSNESYVSSTIMSEKSSIFSSVNKSVVDE